MAFGVGSVTSRNSRFLVLPWRPNASRINEELERQGERAL